MSALCRALACRSLLLPSYSAAYSWGFRTSWTCIGPGKHRWQRFYHLDGEEMSSSEVRDLVQEGGVVR